MKSIDQKLNVLLKIAELFNREGIKWAVGASLLLYLKGYVEEFHDIDLMIYDEDAEKAKDLVLTIGEMEEVNANPYRANHFYVFDVDTVEVDLMGDYFVMKDGVEYRIGLDKESVTEIRMIQGIKIPLDSINSWRRHYDVMGRQAKVDLIDSKDRRNKVQ